jgi:hypothetical protein
MAGSIHDLYSRSWFHRTWTLQELALAQESTVICGRSSMSWDWFSICGKMYLFTKVLNTWAYAPAVQGFFNQRNTECDVRLFENIPKSRRGEAAIALLSRSRSQASSNPQDKIYGLYDLLDYYGISIPKPSHKKLTETIFEEAMIAVIESCGLLSLLGEVCSPGRMKNLPSWIPDWSDPCRYNNKSIRYSATKSSKANQKFHGDRKPGQLPLRGKLYSRIAKCCDASAIPDLAKQEPDGDYRLANSCFREWYHFVLDNSNNRTEEEQRDEFFEIMTLAQNMDEQSRSQSLSLFSQWLDLLLQTEKESEVETEESFFQSLMQHEQNLNNMSLWNFFRFVIQTEHIDHILFITENNQFGCSHFEARKDDLVVLFAGANYPMVIRPDRDDTFRLIGPAYINGIMLGDAWSEEELKIYTLV